jgi:hypothetical protein
MNCYGTPTSRPSPAEVLRSKFERSLAAARGSAGHVRQGYLNEALHSLHNIERTDVRSLLELAPKFAAECSTSELLAAVEEEIELLQAEPGTYQPAIDLVININLR